MRGILGIASAVLSLCLLSQQAWAEKRVALVIGNSAYQKVNPLANPVNDSGAISATFKSAGFDVVELKRDLNVTEMRRALRDFSNTVRDADVAIVYYAGHGIEIDGINYLIPVDAVLENDIDAFDEAIPLDRLLTVIEPAKQLRLVILDACRDNPFNKTMKRTIGARAIGRGLAKVEPGSPNTLIAFAAKAGSTASDGDSKNSPFTAALVKYLPRPGLDLRKAFGFARDEVLKVTNNKQEPFIYGSLGGNDVSLVPGAPAVAAPPSPSSSADAELRQAYELALAVGTKAVWDAFIVNYPSGFYTELAKAQRNKALAEEARVAATERAKAAEEEKIRLASEGARAAEQTKAAAQAKAAEETRVAAEKKKTMEEAKVAEAERTAAAAKVAEDSKLAAAGKAANDRPVGPIANLAPSDQNQQSDSKSDKPPLADVPRLLQSELRRVGCNTGAIEGNWNTAAQKSLALFNKYAGMTFDVKVASLDALDVVKSKPGRICPLVCEHGFKADGEQCTKVSCRAGYEVGNDNECEKIETKKPAAKRDEAPAARTQRTASEPSASKPTAPSGQILCNNAGCRPVAKGCRLERQGNGGNGMNQANQVEICN
jgi:uncharacterized caspase-like protein